MVLWSLAFWSKCISINAWICSTYSGCSKPFKLFMYTSEKRDYLGHCTVKFRSQQSMYSLTELFSSHLILLFSSCLWFLLWAISVTLNHPLKEIIKEEQNILIYENWTMNFLGGSGAKGMVGETWKYIKKILLFKSAFNQNGSMKVGYTHKGTCDSYVAVSPSYKISTSLTKIPIAVWNACPKPPRQSWLGLSKEHSTPQKG